MLTQLKIRNFKGFQDVDIELGQSVVLVGPNNSGKTTVLQALALWYAGVHKWLSLDTPIPTNESPDGAIDLSKLDVTLNRLNLVSIPIPSTDLLWRNLTLTGDKAAVTIRIEVEGITDDKTWNSIFHFVYANPESIYCFPGGYEYSGVFSLPNEVRDTRIAFLPSMSGLVAQEPLLQPGRINVLMGEGRTAEVLRNICYELYETNGQTRYWDRLVDHINASFGVELLPPDYVVGRGEIRMIYKTSIGATLDLTSSGRGMHQTILLLAYLYLHPNTVLLLDEPDAHLEIIRQREIYGLLTKVAKEQGSQIIAASHSEVVLEEAAGLDIAVALVGKPHRIDKHNKSQVAKALKSINAVDYYQAERMGWVLYLEGQSDLAILRAFANILGHNAAEALERPFVHYLNLNKPSVAANHFQGLREAKNDLVGVALFDRIPKRVLQNIKSLTEQVWQKREIENYLCMPETLLAYARESTADIEKNELAMQASIDVVSNALRTLGRPSPWSVDIKASEEFLEPLFEQYFSKLGLPNIMRKTNYHVLAGFVPKDKIDPEVSEKLDAIVQVARQAKPRED